MFKRNIIIISAICIVLLFTIYKTIGIFVIQPIGMIPEGTTIVYLRIGTPMPFITSADGMLLKSGGVSLFGRAIILSATVSIIKDKTIIKAPYSESLYLFTTGGKSFQN